MILQIEKKILYNDQTAGYVASSTTGRRCTNYENIEEMPMNVQKS